MGQRLRAGLFSLGYHKRYWHLGYGQNRCPDSDTSTNKCQYMWSYRRDFHWRHQGFYG